MSSLLRFMTNMTVNNGRQLRITLFSNQKMMYHNIVIVQALYCKNDILDEQNIILGGKYPKGVRNIQKVSCLLSHISNSSFRHNYM